MKPTVGRIVHYFYPSRDGRTGVGTQVDPCAAIITKVHGDGVVDLVLFEASSPETNGRLSVGRADIPATGRWMWPPREKTLKEELEERR